MLFSRTFGILAFIALLLGMPSSASADDMKSSKYYTMSSSTDHLSFSVLLTDLNWKNTWAKDGYIRAVSGSTSIKLLTVYTKDMSSDNNENYNVFANNNLKGGIAFLTNAVGGEKWEQLSVRPEIGSTQNYSYSDNSIEPNKYYKYLILNVPKTWEGSADIANHELDNPSDATINMLGHVESGVVSTSPTMDIYGLTQDVTVEDKVKLNWQYSRVPVKSKTVRFQLLRRIAGSDSWGNLDEVQAEANPAAGTVVSYTDNTIASNRVRYDYKVQLPINDNKNIFESDITTAGVISGSTITALDATKGQHADIVRVKWDVKQVGTDATNFELFRRYANSKDDFMKIYATSGNSDSYSFDDNTVQPGYYYEYKIEAYAGDKASYGNTSYQNALTAIGFCQSTGTISGRVTFGSSVTSVDDVRLTFGVTTATRPTYSNTRNA